MGGATTAQGAARDDTHPPPDLAKRPAPQNQRRSKPEGQTPQSDDGETGCGGIFPQESSSLAFPSVPQVSSPRPAPCPQPPRAEFLGCTVSRRQPRHRCFVVLKRGFDKAAGCPDFREIPLQAPRKPTPCPRPRGLALKPRRHPHPSLLPGSMWSQPAGTPPPGGWTSP